MYKERQLLKAFIELLDMVKNSNWQPRLQISREIFLGKQMIKDHLANWKIINQILRGQARLWKYWLLESSSLTK